MRIAAYQHGIYPRSEDVVAATRGLERGRTSPDEVDRAFAADRADFIRIQQEAGLDYFSDGLLRWQDIFRPLVALSGGMDARSLVRWFDNNSFFRAPELIGDLTLTAPIPREMEDDEDLPPPKMATLPSPYLFSRAAHWDDDRNELMRDLTREVLAPVAGALRRRGYELFHLEEPWLAYVGASDGDWDDFGKAVGDLREATEGATLVLHVYFGDAGPHVERLLHLPVDAVGVDLVETDLDELGSRWEIGVMAGVLDGRSSPIEPVDGAVGLLKRLADTLDPPTLLVSSNSELEMLPRDIAGAKVRRLGEVAARLKGDLA